MVCAKILECASQPDYTFHTCLDVGGDGGLVLVQGVVVVQDGGGDDSGVGEVPLIQTQLIEAAHHAVGLHAPQLAAADLHPAGQGAAVQGDGAQVALFQVLRAGHDGEGRRLAHIHRADPQMVGVGVALQL